MTTVLKNQLRWLLIPLLGLSLVACQKKCQQPATEKYKTITATEWRMVETTDPTFGNLNNTTFLIFNFGKDYSGTINKVENNKKYDTPVMVFKYNVDPDQQLLRLKYENTVPEDSGTDTSTTQEQIQTQDTAPRDYAYELNREFDMVDQSKGYYYRFVPFEGIVDPDNQCSF